MGNGRKLILPPRVMCSLLCLVKKGGPQEKLQAAKPEYALGVEFTIFLALGLIS